jgi:predicted dinucleotide-binding enzyme
MLIAMVGDGQLAEVLARAAERAGQTVVWMHSGDASRATRDADVVILAGSQMASRSLDTVAQSAGGSVIIDAADPSVFSKLPRTARVVRAFASVPVDALAAATTDDATDILGVPLAGNDVKAKTIVASLMHGMGLEPFDVGALAAADLLEPGGALWGRALTPIELLEQVGELSGDG